MLSFSANKCQKLQHVWATRASYANGGHIDETDAVSESMLLNLMQSAYNWARRCKYVCEIPTVSSWFLEASTHSIPSLKISDICDEFFPISMYRSLHRDVVASRCIIMHLTRIGLTDYRCHDVAVCDTDWLTISTTLAISSFSKRKRDKQSLLLIVLKFKSNQETLIRVFRWSMFVRPSRTARNFGKVCYGWCRWEITFFLYMAVLGNLTVAQPISTIAFCEVFQSFVCQFATL